VNTLGTAVILVSTIVLAMAVGIGTVYFIISAILNVFARKPQQAAPQAPSTRDARRHRRLASALLDQNVKARSLDRAFCHSERA
jgi:hypothetical protein